MSITIPLILIISISYLDSLIIIFIGIGILPGKFLIYLSEESNNTIVKSLTLFYCIAIIFYIYSYYYSKDRIQQQETNRYLFIKINGLILSLVSLISQWGIRVSYYVNALDCILLPRIIRSYKNDKVKYLLFNIAIIILLVIIWYSSVVVNNSGQTYPYKSEILDQFL